MLSTSPLTKQRYRNMQYNIEFIYNFEQSQLKNLQLPQSQLVAFLHLFRAFLPNNISQYSANLWPLTILLLAHPQPNPISSNVYENNFAKQKTMTKINRGHNIFFFTALLAD